MDKNKEIAIRKIVENSIKEFAVDFEKRHKKESLNPNGTINMKKNNCFINEIGGEFVFYSALVRSFDSSFGRLLEKLGNKIAKISYKTNNIIHSYILTEEIQHISNLLDKYEDDEQTPKISHYTNFYTIEPANIESFKTKHACDNWFYDEKNKIHYLVELKAGGDLDNKKAKAEKLALLKEYFMLRHLVPEDEKIIVKFATAYNKFGEGKEWFQSNVLKFFAYDELLIGKDYWNFVCNEPDGFEIIFDQYKKSVCYLKEILILIKSFYY